MNKLKLKSNRNGGELTGFCGCGRWSIAGPHSDRSGVRANAVHHARNGHAVIVEAGR